VPVPHVTQQQVIQPVQEIPIVKRKVHLVQETVVHRPVPVPMRLDYNPAPCTLEPTVRRVDPKHRRAGHDFPYHNPIDGCHFGAHRQGQFSWYTDTIGGLEEEAGDMW
jgi:hypothetical protein